MGKHHWLLVAMTLPLLAGCLKDGNWQESAEVLARHYGGGTVAGAQVSEAQVSQGLKEALAVGTRNVVAQLGKSGGFTLDPKVRIPLPPALARVDKALAAVGMQEVTRDLETRMNRAAEEATPQAKTLFLDAIGKMTIADARQVLGGGQDAATQYLRQNMGEGLANAIAPIVERTLAQAGAVQAYDRVTADYRALPFVGDAKVNLNSYVTGKALDGIFYYIAQEEAAIRRDPMRRTSELLRTVFGAQ